MLFRAPAWIGLIKNASGVDIWNDQCINSTTAAYANYDDGSKSTLAGAAYSMQSSGTWKGSAPDASAGIKYGLCRKGTSLWLRHLMLRDRAFR